MRGNPETQVLFRFRSNGKVANLGRGGRLERVKPIFLLEKLWRVVAYY